MNEHFSLAPKVFKLKTKDGSETVINSRYIFYISCTKENKTIYLTEPVLIDGKENWKIEWKNRKYGVRKLLEFLAGRGFVQINRTTIIQKIHISGRDSDWKYVYITMRFNRTCGEWHSSWKNIALPLGRTFAHQVKNHVFKSLFTLKSKEGDIFFVNPIDIAFIELSRGKKVIYLEKPACRNDKNNYKLEWMSRKPLEELITNESKSWFTRVHRRFYVRIDYPYKMGTDKGRCFLSMKIKKTLTNENAEVYNKNIPVGKKYFEQCLEVFSGR